MQIKDLIRELSQFDENARILFWNNEDEQLILNTISTMHIDEEIDFDQITMEFTKQA